MFLFSSRFAINVNYLISQGRARTYLRCGAKYSVILLEIPSDFQQFKNFQNRLRFEKVIARSLVASLFLEHSAGSVLVSKIQTLYAATVNEIMKNVNESSSRMNVGCCWC